MEEKGEGRGILGRMRNEKGGGRWVMKRLKEEEEREKSHEVEEEKKGRRR